MPGLLVHDWIERTGGSEKVVDAFASMFPEAPLYCLWSNDPGRYPGRTVRESWVARTPLRDRKALALAVMSVTMRRASTLEADWALVSSHSFAHHFASDGRRRALPTGVYVHSPARYLWAPEVDPRGASRLVRSAAGFFRAQDRRYAGSGAAYAVNSAYIADRARRAWGVEARVIHPPVEVDRAHSLANEALSEGKAERMSLLPDAFVLGASRFVSYKRLTDVINFGEQVGLPVVLAGSGPEEGGLRARAARARVPVSFVLSPSDGELAHLYARSTVYVFPPVEDFGMMPVEALACGGRVVVNCEGGAGEIVAAIGGGTTTDFQREDARRTLDRALAGTGSGIDEVRASFGPDRFRFEVLAWLREHLPLADVPPVS